MHAAALHRQSLFLCYAEAFVVVICQLVVLLRIVRAPVTRIITALTALNADELAGAGERGEAQLRQSLRQLGGEKLLLRLDAPLVRVPKVDIQFTAVIHGNLPLLKALTPAVRCLSGEVLL